MNATGRDGNTKVPCQASAESQRYSNTCLLPSIIYGYYPSQMSPRAFTFEMTCPGALPTIAARAASVGQEPRR